MGERAKAAISTVSVIKPPNTLQRRVAVVGDGNVDFDAVKRAEQALEKLSTQFDDWMADETRLLVEARRAFLAAVDAKEALDALFRAAHDIKGQAPTLGYPLVSALASSLCRLLEHVDQPRVPRVLIDQHVDAVRAVVDEVGKDGKSKTGELLCRKLLEVTADFIAQETAIKSRQGTSEPVAG